MSSVAKLKMKDTKATTLPAMKTDGRLSSLKVPRDLTLTGASIKPKKIFTPNLNVTRNKNKPTVPSPVASAKTNKSERRAQPPRTRASGKLIQSRGVFSEGIGDTRAQHSSRVPSERGSVSTRAIPSSSHSSYSSADTKKNGSSFRGDTVDVRCMKDQIFDDSITTTVFDYDCPITIGQKADAKCKLEPSSDVCDSAQFSMVKELFESQNQLLYFQLPEYLPAYGKPPEDEKSNIATSTSTPECPLESVNEGYLGKLLVYKSGKMVMKLGHVTFDVELGPKRNFVQNMIAVESGANGNVLNLGAINADFIITPNMSSLVNS